MSDHQFIFVAGLHRSGTSLVHRIIRNHPEVTGFKNAGVPKDEGQHLQTVYPKGTQFGGPGKFSLKRDAYMDEHHPLTSKSTAEKILKEWSSYLDLSKRYIVEKSPPNIIRSRFLQALFPRSKFVFILRHPLVVSYATQKWAKTSIKALMKHTLYAYECFLHDLPYIRQARVIRYEEFVVDPGEESKKLFAFLGLEAFPIQQTVDSKINQKYFDLWHRDQARLSRA
jgi:hypothetical protein